MLKKLVVPVGLVALFYGLISVGYSADVPQISLLRQEADSARYEFRWSAAPSATHYRLTTGPQGSAQIQSETTFLADTLWVALHPTQRTYSVCVAGINRRPNGEKIGPQSCGTYQTPAPIATPGAPGIPNVTPIFTTPPPPNPGGVVLNSTWSTALGSGDAAITDGGKWNEVICSGTSVMSVVSGIGHSWTLTPNVLQIVNQGPTGCKNVENNTAIPQDADDYYIRLYVRLENVGTGGSTGHSVSMNTRNPIQGTYWAITDPVANATYYPRVGIANRIGLAMFGYRGPLLNQNQWYRFESHVEFYDEANPLRFRIWPFVYNMNGALIADASGYITNDWPNLASLADEYGMGGYGIATDRNLSRVYQVGYEGSAGNNDIGGRWYYAGAEVRTDTFPGAIQ